VTTAAIKLAPLILAADFARLGDQVSEGVAAAMRQLRDALQR
jgi:hypothetical protein